MKDIEKLAIDLASVRDEIASNMKRAEALAADEIYLKLCKANEVYPAVSLFLAGLRLACLGLEGFIEAQKEARN